jgi:enoyl-CoA hydratase/carnithine racemase
MTYNTLDWTVADGILTLTLNRPEQLNSFTVEMADELEAAFKRASNDAAVRAIVVTGAGRAFCAGMDLTRSGNVFGLDENLQPGLQDMHERLDEPAIHNGLRDTGGRVTLSIFNCTKPVIAAINGPAVGIGATMTLAMDVRLASEKARIGFVFGKIGIVPEACSSWFLPRIVGISQALEWCYTADILDAEEAQRGGLVKAVLPPEQLLPEAYKLARRFVDKRSPVATALTLLGGRLARRVLRQPQGRQGRRRLVPREARAQLHRDGAGRSAAVLQGLGEVGRSCSCAAFRQLYG